MMRLRDLVQDALWVAFRGTVNAGRTVARHWRRVVAATTMGIAIARAVIWIAKAIGSAASVDTALNLVGLGEYVAPFEEAVDHVLATVVAIILTVTPTG